MVNDSSGDIASQISDDPETAAALAAFVKSQPGMKNWRPGKPVPKAMMAAFLAKEMKTKGLKVDKRGITHGPNGQPLNGWQDVARALGIKPAAAAASSA